MRPTTHDLLSVFSFLSRKDCCHCHQVCKFWHEVTSSPLLERFLKLSCPKFASTRTRRPLHSFLTPSCVVHNGTLYVLSLQGAIEVTDADGGRRHIPVPLEEQGMQTKLWVEDTYLVVASSASVQILDLNGFTRFRWRVHNGFSFCQVSEDKLLFFSPWTLRIYWFTLEGVLSNSWDMNYKYMHQNWFCAGLKQQLFVLSDCQEPIVRDRHREDAVFVYSADGQFLNSWPLKPSSDACRNIRISAIRPDLFVIMESNVRWKDVYPHTHVKLVRTNGVQISAMKIDTPQSHAHFATDRVRHSFHRLTSSTMETWVLQ